MDKESFLRQLEYLLSGVPGLEKEEAVSFYRDYFEEAGPEREAEILEGLGSPAKVAAEIIGNLSGDRESGEFTETGYHDARFEERGNMPDRYAKIMKAEPGNGQDKEAEPPEAREGQESCKGASEDYSGTGAGSGYRGGYGEFGRRPEAQGGGEDTESYTGEVEWENRGRSGSQGESWRSRAENAWHTARDSEWGRKAENAWNSARDSEWGRKAENAWNSARENAKQQGKEREDGRDAHSREEGRGSYSREDGRDAYSREDSRDAYSREDGRDAYTREDGGDSYGRDDGWKAYGGQERRDEERQERRSDSSQRKPPVKRRNGNRLLFLLLFLFVGLPVAGSIISAGFSVAAAVIGGVFGIFGGLFGLIGAGIGGICAAFAGGMTLIATGIYNIAAPAAGIMMIGLGLLSFAGGFLLIILVKWGCVVAVPGVFRAAVEVTRKIIGFCWKLVRGIFGRGGEA